MSVLDDPGVNAAIRTAWTDSQSGTRFAHEEGGFVLQQADGKLTVERWPMGQTRRVFVPDHTGGKRHGLTIIATFHTHPDTRQGFPTRPSHVDVVEVRDDPDLKHSEYEGEFVVSSQLVYRIVPSGKVETIGRFVDLLS